MRDTPRLFLVVLGGRTATSHIELHDVRWVVGSDIEATIPALKQQWFGLKRGLHIDSYVAVKQVDGYKVELIRDRQELTAEVDPMRSEGSDRLWFVNLGGYDSGSLQELHQFGLIVAPSKQAAKARARRRWLNDADQVHKDDLHGIERLNSVDDCLPIEGLEGWRIQLKADPSAPKEELKPDWYGYRLI